MASGIKPSGYFIFDQQTDGAVQKEERPDFARRLKLFIKSRYALLAICFLLAGSLIFYNTAALQLNPSAASSISETTGTARQQTITAARGDIVDAAGVPLAYSKSVNTIMITNAGLETAELNAMLLDLSLFLSANQIKIEDHLSEYFTISHDGCEHADGAGEDCGEPVFVLDTDKIIYWQSDSNLFNLTTKSDGLAATFDDSRVKTDPQVFYDYLLIDKFEIEDPLGDGQKYSRTDAFRIMQLRYLIMENNWAFRNGTPLDIARNVSNSVVSSINEQNYRFLGVITGQAYERAYTDDASSVCHVLGYVGRITSDEYEELRSQGYSADAIIGQAGVESTAERYLAGQDGIKPYNIWTVAGEDGSFYSESVGKDAVPGFNVRLTIDLTLQKIAENSLQSVITQISSSANNKNKGDADAGAVVMIDVKTGAILAMVSNPGYDPNDFIKQADDKAAAARVKDYLFNNVSKPMWNRAIMENYAPGSTFKPATAAAALQSGAITSRNNIIRCKGHEVIGEWPWFCLEFPGSGHGNLTLSRALATSCNMYFFNLGYRTGINQIDYWGKMLGLGEYSGIDLPGEAKGIRASRTTKKLLRNNPEDQIWFPADTCQTAIGQFDNSFTIIQLAVYTSALATGKRITPHVISDITGNDGVIIQDFKAEPQSIGLADSTLQAIRLGMIAAANDREGTAYRAFQGFPIKVAAKTGTAETGFEDISSSNGLFICYAPADNPQVAIAQIVEKGAWGSNTIQIAKDLLTAYFKINGTVGEDAAALPGITIDLTPVETTITP
jgi:penicillin-binding protein 2